MHSMPNHDSINCTQLKWRSSLFASAVDRLRIASSREKNIVSCGDKFTYAFECIPSNLSTFGMHFAIAYYQRVTIRQFRVVISNLFPVIAVG